MSTWRFLLRSARLLMLWIGVLGLLGSAINAGLVAVVHRALSSSDALRGWLALAFIGLALGKALIGYLSGHLLHGFAQRSVTELRRELIRKLLTVPYRRLEQVGPARIQASLTQDVSVINYALQAVPSMLVNAAVLVGGVSYLWYLHWPTCAALLCAGLPGIAIHRMMSKRARRRYELQRSEHDELQRHFRGLTDGAKELKMHVGRRRAFLHDAVFTTTQALLDHDLYANGRYLLGQAINGVLVLAMIGLVLFVLPGVADVDDPQLLSGYVLTGLYLVGPLAGVLRIGPVYARAQIALSRIDELGVQLTHEDGGEPEATGAPASAFESIELDSVGYRYGGPSRFALGPVSLRIAPGELVFITGGNGSGKSTLAKLLCGLYTADSGELRWNGAPVAREQRDAYRQLWSTVFFEFHLFDRLYGVPADVIARAAPHLLAELGLDAVVSIEDGRLSVLELSSGQRKRLALLVALIEDRPAYLFDEWAADQDPDFKETFYRSIVPELARRGKAVVVVTHDDRYFDVADRVLEMREGQGQFRSERDKSAGAGYI